MADPIFWDGFERQDLLKWTVGGAPALESVTVRKDPDGYGGVRSIKFVSLGDYLIRGLGSTETTLYVGFGHRFTALPSSTSRIIVEGFSGGGGDKEFKLTVSSAGALELYVWGGTPVAGQIPTDYTLKATSTKSLAIDRWYWIEVKYIHANAGGVFEVRVDGEVWATFTGDTKGAYDSGAPRENAGLTFLKFEFTGSAATFLDDIVVRTDRYPGNTFLVAAQLNANGALLTGLTTVGAADFWSCMDELPPSATDYVEADAVNEEGTFVVADPTTLLPPTVSTIEFVAISATAVRVGEGINNTQLNFRRAGTNNYSANKAIPTSRGDISQARELDPQGSVAWTRSNALGIGTSSQFGFKVVA